jgi:hypothetical protein
VHNLDRTQPGSSSNPYDDIRPRNGGWLSEEQEMDLAEELMELETEEEFENWISRGIDAAGKFINSPTGQALGGALKDAAKQLLPVAGQAVGAYFGQPALGGALGTAASSLLEAETDEQEWEAANVFVRVAVDAIDNAANAPAGADPQAVAHNAVAEAAKRHAPHLVNRYANGGRVRIEAPHRRQHSGHWARHGRRIVVFGV